MAAGFSELSQQGFCQTGVLLKVVHNLLFPKSRCKKPRMCGTLGPQDLDFFFYQKSFQFNLSFLNILKKAKQTMTPNCDRGAGNAHLRQAVAKPELDVRPWQKPWEPHVCTFEVLNTSKKLFSTSKKTVGPNPRSV